MAPTPPPVTTPAAVRPMVPSLEQRCQSLGTTCLALSILELLYCGQKIFGQLFSGTLIEAERSFFPKTPHGPSMGPVLDAAHEMARQIAPWEIARTVPYAAASVVLLLVANRLRRGDLSALAVARQWVFAAFGVVALSLLIQIVAILPATMSYQHAVVASLPAAPTPAGKSAPPFDPKAFVSSFTLGASLVGLVIGTAAMSAWPIILYVWAGKLLREARAAAGR